MPRDFGNKVKHGGIETRVRGDVIAIVQKDKRDVKMLKNIHCPPAEGNFCHEYGYALKPATV